MMSTDSPDMSTDVKWCQYNNTELRKENKVVPGQSEVSDIQQRAMAELLAEHAIKDIGRTTERQRADFCRALDTTPLRENYLRELNRLIREFGPHQVVALVTDAIFAFNVHMVVTKPLWPIEVEWRRVI